MPRRPRPLLTVSAVLSALTVLAAPLALGGTHWPTILALSGLALAAMLAAVAARRDGLRSHWIVWVAWAVAALVGAQLIPLPAGLLHHLSPRAAELHAAAGSASGPLSLSAPATWIAFALQVGFAALLTAVVQLDRRRGRWVADGLAVGGLAVVLVSAVHFAFGFHTIYGVFRPQDAAQMSGFFGPFINPNTQAGYLVLVGLVGLGIAVDATSDRRTRLGLAAAVFALLGAMASGSRGGQAAALFGGLLFAGLAYLRGQHRGDNTREKARQVAKATVALLALGGVAAVLLLPDWMAFDPSHPASDGKLAAWPGAVAHARAFWLAGSGRGAFEYVHPLFQSVSGQGTVTHPENHLLQLAADLGLPLAIATVAAFVGAWIDAVRRLDRRTAPAVWGVLAGLAAVGCQQLVDFGLEAAGLALPVAAALGLMVNGARPPDRRPEPTRPWVAWATLGAGALCAALLTWQGPASLAHHPDRDIARIASAEDWQQAEQAARQRHPADGLVALAGALRAAGSPTPLPALLKRINVALTLRPQSPRPHLLAARAFVAAGLTAQAAGEYRLAAEKGAWTWLALSKEIARRLTRPEDLARAVPATPEALRPLGNMVLLEDGARARRLAELWLTTHPEDGSAHALRGQACAKTADWACVTVEAEWLIAHDQPATGWALRGTQALRQGDRDTAIHALTALMATDATEPALYAAVRLAEQLGDLPAARQAYDRLWRRVGARPEAARTLLVNRARTEDRLGTPEQALRAWQTAHRHAPNKVTQAGLTRAEARLRVGRKGSPKPPPLENSGNPADLGPHPTAVEP